MTSRLPYIKAMISQMGLEAFLEAEVAAVRTRPVPHKLADSFAKEREKLSPAEVRILKLAAQGLTERETAKVLKRSINTVKSHRRLIYAKLGARNISQALAIATERGYFY